MVILSFCSILSLVVIHLGGYFFDQTFFIFLGTIIILTFFVAFENYLSKKLFLIILLFLMSVEIFLWRYFLEPIWKIYIIEDFNLQLIHSFLPLIVIILTILLSFRVKWFALKASLTLFIYFCLASLIYTLYVKTNQLNWFISIVITIIYTAIVFFVSSFLEKNFLSSYKYTLDINIPKLGIIQKYSKSQNALSSFVSYNNIKVAPFFTLYFPKLYDLKKFGSYRKQKKNIFKFLSLVEKTISLIIPNSKKIFFESGYYETSFLFSIPNLQIQDLINTKGVINKDVSVKSLKSLVLIINSLNNLSFQMIIDNDINKSIEIKPFLGLSFYGYSGELFYDLLQQSTINFFSSNIKNIYSYTIEDMYQKLFFKYSLINNLEIITSPLIETTQKKVLFNKKELGIIITFVLKGNLEKSNITNLSKNGQIIFYSQKMYANLIRMIKKNEQKVFITIPSNYFSSKMFNTKTFLRKIDFLETELNTKIEIIIRNKLTINEVKTLKDLRAKGISFSSQLVNRTYWFLFNYIFEDDAEYTNSSIIECERINSQSWLWQSP